MNDNYCFYCSSDLDCILGYTHCNESTHGDGGDKKGIRHDNIQNISGSIEGEIHDYL